MDLSRIKFLYLKRFIIILTIILNLGAFTRVSAQYKNEKDATIPLEHFYIERKHDFIRQVLSKIHFGLSTGINNTFYNHELNGFGIIKQSGSAPVLFSGSNTSLRYSNWTNTVTESTQNPQTGEFQVNSDTTALGFKSRMFSIPLTLTAHIEFDRYRIGAGYGIAFTSVGDFNPTNFADEIGSYAPEQSTFLMKQYFIMLGATVYRYYEYALVADINIGGYKLGKSFDQGINKSIYYNFGLSIERDMSEYFKVFVRPSYEIKNYTISIPEANQSITHNLNAFNLNFGVRYRLPELRRCFLKSCHAQLNHAHGDREYRSRRHPIYKKQNPHYGENYPNLIKYKGKNKNKLNPY